MNKTVELTKKQSHQSSETSDIMEICIIGAGWYGCHLAISLKKSYTYNVVLIEKNADILSGISGKFGIRLHAGPHYPRSKKTRESCQRGFNQFYELYKELIVPHEYSIYGLGKLDADNLPSKVSPSKFRSVCLETDMVDQTNNPEEWGYTNLHYAAKISEPSIVVGDILRKKFKRYLKQADVDTRFNLAVTELRCMGQKISVLSQSNLIGKFDYIINTTSYQDKLLLPKKLNLPLKIKYQTCLALVYKDKAPTSDKPFSFIVLDGFFPCMMPYLDKEKNDSDRKYILTHGRWTILGSFDTTQEAQLLLESLDDNDINIIREKSEAEMKRFWPIFEERFEYLNWKGAVLAKLVTSAEFRSAVTYAVRKNIIHVIPGKISNIFDVEKEAIKLITHNEENIIYNGDYSYVGGGVLDIAMSEITKLPNKNDGRNTCSLQTYRALTKFSAEPMDFSVDKNEHSQRGQNKLKKHKQSVMLKRFGFISSSGLNSVSSSIDTVVTNKKDNIKSHI